MANHGTKAFEEPLFLQGSLFNGVILARQVCCIRHELSGPDGSWHLNEHPKDADSEKSTIFWSSFLSGIFLRKANSQGMDFMRFRSV